MLTEPIRGLLDDVASSRAAAAAPSQGAVLEINQMVAAAAGMYEKVRYLIDYREEHTIRRAAIERILKRHLLIEKKKVDGARLLQELVESQYLPKEAVSELEIRKTDETLARFLQLQFLSGRSRDVAKRVLSLAASEIESAFSATEYAIDRACIDAMYKITRPRIALNGFSADDIDVQVFCAARRALLASDDATLSYALWCMYVPDWRNGDTDLTATANHLRNILTSIDRSVQHPLQWQIVPRIKNESIYFRIIRELFMQQPKDAETILAHKDKLDGYVKGFLEKKYEKENTRIKSSGIRAVAYLFLTKMIMALTIELPYETFVLGAINYVALGTNLLFHPLLLLTLTRGVRSLGDANTAGVLKGMHHMLYEGPGRPIHVYARYTQFTPFFAAFYFFLVMGIFGAIFTALQLLEFNIVGMVLFVFFLALVSYFAYRIRSNARRWRVTGQDSTIILIGNMLSVPIVRAGRWLSRTFSSINVFVVIMDFIIETPFRLILDFSHQFILYLKEKADEVY